MTHNINQIIWEELVTYTQQDNVELTSIKNITTAILCVDVFIYEID